MPKLKFPFFLTLLALTLAIGLTLTACSDDANSNSGAKTAALQAFKAEPILNTGDPTKGQAVFQRLPCLTCHNLNGQGVLNGTGPSLNNVATTASTRLDGVTAVQYLRHALLKPEDLQVPGYRPVMPGWGGTLSPPEIDDLVAFLMSQK